MTGSRYKLTQRRAVTAHTWPDLLSSVESAAVYEPDSVYSARLRQRLRGVSGPSVISKASKLHLRLVRDKAEDLLRAV